MSVPEAERNMFEIAEAELNVAKEAAQRQPNPLAEEASGFLSQASDGFTNRAHEAAENKTESLTRAAVSFSLGAVIAVATRGRGVGTSMALGAAGAASLQTAWSYLTHDSSDNNSSQPESFASRLGATTFDAVALGAAPGLFGSAAGRFGSNLYESNFGKASKDALPLNAWSRSTDPIGKEISNFAKTPFTLDGKKYESMEGFYVSLLFKDPARRAEISQLSGLPARLAGKSSNLKVTPYMGEQVVLGSEKHHAILKRALEAKFEQNPGLAREFVATRPRPVIHDTGHADPKSFLPNDTFAKMLTEIREKLARQSW